MYSNLNYSTSLILEWVSAACLCDDHVKYDYEIKPMY